MVRSCGESWREDAIEFQGFSLPRVWVNVKSWQILLSLILAPAVVALHTTGMTGEGRGVTFSEKFRHAYAAATVDQTNAKCIGKLNAMREEFVKPEEVAEIELTLGVIYGQRTGLRDPVKAVPHFTKALNHDLPPTTRTRVLLWRGNALEQQERRRAALPDYIRGLMMCTQFDLSHGWPKQAPRLEDDPRRETAVDPKALDGPRSGPGRAGPDAMMQTHLLRIEREMLQFRYYLVEAVKRVAENAKLDAVDLEKEIAYIVSDSRRATQILLWCQDKNERPWP